MSTILELNNIKKAYDVKMAVDIEKLVIEEGDCVGLVGESGCGKSTLAGIITNTVKLYSGSVIFKGEDISRFNARKMRDIYKNMPMIYQSPVASFDPEYTLGKSVAEALRNNKSDNLVSELFISVGLSAEYVNKYPGQVSGGECQRAAIARALAVKPEFLICDEATSALDVTVQSQIIAPQSSSGLAMRCIGNIGCHAAISSGSTKSGSTDIGVATYPGLTELTRIFLSIHSIARLLVMWITPALDALYAAWH